MITADVDECEFSLCPSGSHCLNTDGSFVCSCDVGYHYVSMTGPEESKGRCIGNNFGTSSNLILKPFAKKGPVHNFICLKDFKK